MHNLSKTTSLTQPNHIQPFDVSILAGQVSSSTMAMYERDFRAYLQFAEQFEHAVQSSTLARWRTHMAEETTKSPHTINRMLSAVKRLMREAALQGYISNEQATAFDLVPGVKIAAMKDRLKSNNRVKIEPHEMRQVVDTPAKHKANATNPEVDDSTTEKKSKSAELVSIRDHALLATLAGSALRVSELTSLTKKQIKRKGTGYIVLVRGKNDIEYREAPLSREAFGYIEFWLSARPVDSQYIFTAFDGRGGKRLSERPISSVAVWKIVRRYCAEHGMTDIKPHDFRRFVGTQLAKHDIRQAQKALGHKRLETTARHYILDELEAGLTDDLF
ncbi:MAG: tyrosine-type recombinase/integrase [Chloroflexota bacterium]